jgi:fructose-specific phosphotransferase system IIC component
MVPLKTRIKRFVISILTKILIFVLVLGVLDMFFNSPILANYIAMGQLDHDNISYIFWSIYVVIKGTFNSLCDLIVCLFAGTIIYDIYEFIKINKGEK